MKRRSLFATAAIAGLASPVRAAATHKAIFELTYIRMRNNKHHQMKRTREFVSGSVVPAMKRAGAGPIGVFTNLIGQHSPTITMLATYPSLVDMEIIANKMAGDSKFNEQVETFNRSPGLSFQRIEKELLQAFDSMPGVEIPPLKGGVSRVFELRRYESDTFLTLKRKMGMFDNGEISIFRKCGLQPVFFGEMLIGPRMPNLTYMIAVDSWADREKAWARFVKHPDWKALVSKPGFSDAEIVANISNSILRPLPGSDIR